MDRIGSIAERIARGLVSYGVDLGRGVYRLDGGDAIYVLSTEKAYRDNWKLRDGVRKITLGRISGTRGEWGDTYLVPETEPHMALVKSVFGKLSEKAAGEFSGHYSKPWV